MPFPHAPSALFPGLGSLPEPSEGVRYPLFHAQTGSRLQPDRRGSRRRSSPAAVDPGTVRRIGSCRRAVVAVRYRPRPNPSTTAVPTLYASHNYPQNGSYRATGWLLVDRGAAGGWPFRRQVAGPPLSDTCRARSSATPKLLPILPAAPKDIRVAGLTRKSDGICAVHQKGPAAKKDTIDDLDVSTPAANSYYVK